MGGERRRAATARGVVLSKKNPARPLWDRLRFRRQKKIALFGNGCAKSAESLRRRKICGRTGCFARLAKKPCSSHELDFRLASDAGENFCPHGFESRAR